MLDLFVSSEEVLIWHADVDDIELKFVGNLLRWLGNICKMDNNRLVKALLHSELFHGSRPVGQLYLRFKDTCKSALKCGHVLDPWKTAVDNKQEWRTLIRTVCDSQDIKRVKEDGSRQREGDKRSQGHRILLCYIRCFWYIGASLLSFPAG